MPDISTDWIQWGESCTQCIAKILLGLKPSQDSHIPHQWYSPTVIQPLKVFCYRTFSSETFDPATGAINGMKTQVAMTVCVCHPALNPPSHISLLWWRCSHSLARCLPHYSPLLISEWSLVHLGLQSLHTLPPIVASLDLEPWRRKMVVLWWWWVVVGGIQRQVLP